ncbi:hypothetical protein JR316_0003026 [Psilocybe cubensis]|uniref:Uncharacterized protein n=2 Tax=Psilocybe cubensis TaxID=181762 RepID=A0ACB8H6R2_PSICU|nr:hypothetical protein JR316_0003026 [Psilocybe cubensis]KAH9483556.1 hypothetical protein JR316_0003026 [Psilocybe cubensis]
MHASALSLPIELLYFIFEHLQNQTQEEPNDLLAEIVVSHVCSAWRSIAIGYPRFWSWYAYRHEKRHKQELERLVVYLERSCNHPLYLWFVLRSYLPGPRILHPRAHSDTKESRAISLIQKATKHARRWRCISIDIRGAEESYQRSSSFFSPLQNLSFPELETFEVYVPRLLYSAYLDDLFGGELATPKLWFVRIDPISSLHFNPPHSITTLELHWEYGDPYPLMPEFLEVLLEIMASPMLTTVSIIGEMFDDACTTGFLSKRKRFSTSIKNLRCSSSIFSSAIFRHFQFPRLEMLFLQEIVLRRIFNFRPIDPILKIFPRLRTLILLNCYSLTRECIISLAQYTQNVKHLYILQDPALLIGVHLVDYEERSVFFAIVDEKILSNTTIWPDLDTVMFSTPLPHVISSEQVASCIDIVQIRKKQCMLRIPRYNAKYWESEDPVLWASFSDTGKLEIIPVDANKSIGRWLPWPSRKLQGIKRLADIYNGDPFLRPIDSSLEDYDSSGNS